MSLHPSRICNNYLNTGILCEKCMSSDQEIDYWKTCAQGEHSSEEGCPNYFGSCHCGGSLFKEINFLKNILAEFSKEHSKIYDYLEKIEKEHNIEIINKLF